MSNKGVLNTKKIKFSDFMLESKSEKNSINSRSLILFVIILCSSNLQVMGQGLGLGTESNPINRWPTADPFEMGLDTTALNEHAALCEASAATGCIVAYKGFIVQEWKSPDHDFGPFLGTASATKSITALLVGMLIEDGKIGSVDDLVSEYIPEWKAGADSMVTIKHLLTMSAGLGRLSPPKSVLAAKNMTSFVLELPVTQSPGEKWIYSNEGAQLLSPILEKVAGMPLAAYARERLFGPLGMFWSHFYVDEYNNTVTYGGMETMVSEFARIGQLISNNGMWNGQQILQPEWIEAISTASDTNPGYGYFWWLIDRHNAIAAAGDGDRILTIFPEKELIAVRLQRIASVPGTYTETYFNDRGRMHAKAADILARVVPE